MHADDLGFKQRQRATRREMAYFTHGGGSFSHLIGRHNLDRYYMCHLAIVSRHHFHKGKDCHWKT